MEEIIRKTSTLSIQPKKSKDDKAIDFFWSQMNKLSHAKTITEALKTDISPLVDKICSDGKVDEKIFIQKLLDSI